MHVTTRSVTLSLLLAATAVAQSPSLDKEGGALGGITTLRVHGPANAIYLVLMSPFEATTPVPALGITLDVPPIFLNFSLTVPGFIGDLDGSGDASFSVPLPNDPALASFVLSMQGIVGNGTYQTTNLIRLTPQASGTFAPSLSQPALPIVGGGVAPLANGEFVFCGGSGPAAQLYESRTEEWSASGVTFGVGTLAQSTGLPDGRVLFTGGLDLVTGQPTTAAAIYDPATQQTTTLAMNVARAGHGASVMGNGRVLITGGIRSIDLQNPLTMLTSILGSTEIFDPATGLFTAGPNMLEPRAMHSSTTLSNGQVLIAGGVSVLPIINLPNVSSTAYKFNPATNSFGLPAVFSGARFLHSAVGLSDGKVLIAGGLTLDLSTFLTTLNPLDIVIGTRDDCQLFSAGLLGFGTFATVNGMQEGRAGAAIAALPNGGAVIAGGFQVVLDLQTSTFVTQATASGDLFAQGPNHIVPTGAMAAPRLFPVAVNLPDGTVMVVGGGPAQTEIYQR